jgi:beta-galactosidase
VFGVWCEEQDVLHNDYTNKISGMQGNSLGLSGDYHCYHYADIIHADKAQVLATYESDFYQGEPALTVNSYGNGQAYYMASRNNDEFLSDFYNGLSQLLGLKRALDCDLPDGVTAQVRGSSEAEYVFLMNFTPDIHEVPLTSETFIEVPSGTIPSGGVVTLPGYGICVLKRGVL